jgi:hypothetical protein
MDIWILINRHRNTSVRGLPSPSNNRHVLCITILTAYFTQRYIPHDTHYAKAGAFYKCHVLMLVSGPAASEVDLHQYSRNGSLFWQEPVDRCKHVSVGA